MKRVRRKNTTNEYMLLDLLAKTFVTQGVRVKKIHAIKSVRKKNTTNEYMRLGLSVTGSAGKVCVIKIMHTQEYEGKNTCQDCKVDKRA